MHSIQENNITPRAHNLDALRGFAILTMVLSGTLPWGTLPNWMYHAQVPPPDHVFNPNLPGITWVDLVFPFFLFAMGAAFPLALSKKIEQGMSQGKIVLSILSRGLMLAIFAVFVMHIRPYKLNPNPDVITWLAALGGFAILFMVYLKTPGSWPVNLGRLLKITGWIGLILWVRFIKFPNNGSFSFQRNDIILIVLTNMAVFGAMIWLFTRNNMLLRLGIMGFFLAFRLVHTQWDIMNAIGPEAEPVRNIGSVLFIFSENVKNWMIHVWDYSPFSWLYRFSFLKYLLIVIPGTIAGDLTLNWMKTKNSIADQGEKKMKYCVLALLMFLSLIVILAGLQSRQVFTTFLFSSAIALAALFIVRKPVSDTEKYIKSLVLWGSYWLILGLLFEPFEGGIKKDNSTLSYYFITSGLAFYLITLFTILFDIFKKQIGFSVLIRNGRNPMIAYVGMANFIWPVLHLTGIKHLAATVFSAPWTGFIWSVIETSLLAVCVAWLTKKKIFWKT